MKTSSDYIQLQSVEDSWREGLLILMYHSVGVPPLFHGWRGLHVTPQLLSRQLRELQAAAIPSGSLSEWMPQRSSPKQVVVTFDDAYRNVFLKGLPVLRKLGVRAITYVVAPLIGKSNVWDHAIGVRHERLMDHAELREWLAAGHEIGSHGMTHRPLASLSVEEARREIADSKKMLEDAFGQPIRHFCYPYGSLNEAVRDLVQEAGYETATSTQPGFNTAGTDPFVLRRFGATHRNPFLAALTRR